MHDEQPRPRRRVTLADVAKRAGVSTALASIVIREAPTHQAFGRLPIQIETLRLVVRAFVPVKPKPRHRFEDAARHVFARALDVGIFDAKDESAIVLPRKQPVDERRPGTPDVQVPGGRWRETNANPSLVHRLSFRKAATASRTTSVLESSVRGRICSLDAGSPMLPMTLATPARTFGLALRK